MAIINEFSGIMWPWKRKSRVNALVHVSIVRASRADITDLKSSSVMRRVWTAILSWATSTCFGP